MYVVVQKGDSVTVKLLLKYSPAELLAFTDRMDGRQAEEIARKDAAEELEQEGELDPPGAAM